MTVLVEPMVIARSPIPRRRSKPRRVSVVRDLGFRSFLASEGKCTIRGMLGHVCEGPIDPAHGPVAGMGYKGPDDECIPLCRKGHNEQHRLTWPNFELKYGIDRKHEAAAWWLVYQIHKQGGEAECQEV